MARYKVVGNHKVGGIAPGGTVELDLDEQNEWRLVRGGHLQPVARPRKPASRKVTDGPADSD